MQKGFVSDARLHKTTPDASTRRYISATFHDKRLTHIATEVWICPRIEPGELFTMQNAYSLLEYPRSRFRAPEDRQQRIECLAFAVQSPGYRIAIVPRALLYRLE